MTDNELLHKTAELIEEYGWHQGDYGDRNVGFCISGALWEARRNLEGEDVGESYYEARMKLNTVIREGHSYIGLPEWNDKLPEDTGKEIVVKTLREAANV